MEKFLLCAHRKWALKLYKEIKCEHANFTLISDPKKLTYSNLQKLNPKIIFFPDWSWIIPEKIVENFFCVCFHESDLPKFRGGSPLQNQIIRGIKKTKTTAFLMDKGIDTGNIILKKDLSLLGSIDDIFKRMISNDKFMINKIINNQYKIKKQKGKSSTYKRRTPSESELKNMDYSLSYLYDFIRMLGDPYPNAFVMFGKHKITFKNIKKKGKKLEFTGEIS